VGVGVPGFGWARLAEHDAVVAPGKAAVPLLLVVGLDLLAGLAVVVVVVNVPLALLVFEGRGVICRDFHGYTSDRWVF
jgi:hypothetical protein